MRAWLLPPDCPAVLQSKVPWVPLVPGVRLLREPRSRLPRARSAPAGRLLLLLPLPPPSPAGLRRPRPRRLHRSSVTPEWPHRPSRPLRVEVPQSRLES